MDSVLNKTPLAVEIPISNIAKGVLRKDLFMTDASHHIKIIDLSENQVEELENALDAYDKNNITYKINGRISIGISHAGVIVAGLDACMTAFRILYVSSVYVDEKYRRKGYGKLLIEEMEKRAKSLGANTIRLDTFSWQGKEFYQAMNYEQVGHYKNDTENYEEYFFLKRI